MKNIFSKTTAEKRTQNGVKTDSKRSIYGIRILIFAFLTLGVGQMWAEGIAYSGGYIYFDNSLGINDNTLQICARQSSWTGVSSFSNIDNTKLYYVANPEGSGWRGILGWVVISANPAKDNSNFDNWSSYTWCSDWNTYGFNSGSTYLIVPSSTAKSQSVTTSYYSAGYSALNSTQTINTVVKTGSGSYTAANSKATISISSYAMTGNGAATKQTASISTSAKSTTVSAARTATTTFTVGDVATGYQFDGWYTDATGGSLLSSSKTYTYYPTAATTVYARFSEKMSTVTLTASPSGKGSFTIGGAAATSTTAGVTTTRSVTAVPISGYHFVSWAISGGASISSTTANPTTVTGGGAGTAATLTATFEADAVNSLTVSKGTGISAVSGSTSPVTLGSKYAISATVATGYTFGGWTATPAANGTFDNASSASTNVTVKNGSVVVTASGTERMSTLSTSCHYDAGDPSYAAPTKSVSSIGISTTADLSATAPSTGYTFVGWTLTHCVRTSGDANSRNITVRSDGSGEAATAVANYEEDRSSRWHLVGQNDTGYEIFPDGWNVSNTSMMQKASGHSAESVVYTTVTISSKRTYLFKIVDDNGASDDIWYGYSTGDTYLEWTETSTKNVYSEDGNGNNLKFTPSLLGTYEFKVDYSGTYPAVTITYPEVYAVSGSFNSWTESNNLVFDGNNGSYSVVIDGNSTNYEFKVLDNGSWYGHENKTFTGTESNVALTTPNNNINLKADVYPSGSYTFAYNKSTKKLGVTYPASYVVNYAVGATKGQSTAPWANFTGEIGDKQIDTGTKIASGTTIHLYAANAKTHYTFYGWYTVENPAREDYSKRVSTSQHYSTSVTETKSYYAIYFEDPYWVNTYAEGFGSIDPAAGQNAYIVTPSGNFTATPSNDGFMFDSWEQRSGALTITSPTSNITTVNATAASTLQANFVPRWSVAGLGSGASTWDTDLNQFSTAYYESSSKMKGDKTVTLTANTEYELKMYDRKEGTWYGMASAATDDHVHYAESNNELQLTTLEGNKNIHLHSAAGGTYTFHWNVTDKKLQIEFPTSWFITSGQKTEGQDDNAGGSFTAEDNNSNDVKGGKFVANNASVTFSATPNTGYTFDGWYTNEACTEGKTTTNPLTISSITVDKTEYAKFLPKTYTITLTRTGDGYGSGGDASVTATFNAALPSATMPTAAQGYGFMGFYSAAGGEGRQFINASGEWVANAGDTISDSKWILDDGITLYAYYKEAQITGITFSPGNIVAPSATVTVTATIEPIPAGTTTICWRVLYSNDNPLDPQPTFTPVSRGTVSFPAHSASGSYKVEATLRKGAGCSGDEIHTFTAPFQVAGDHTVTVQYKCGNTTIKASTSVTGKPLEWTEITAPEIVGYSFSKWVEGDGITIEGATEGEKASATINFKAIYDGKLTAVYTQKRMIYFYNTLNWENVYVYFYKDGNYWDNSNGTGTDPSYYSGSHNSAHKGQMLPVTEGSKIYYFDAEEASIPAGYTNVAFTEKQQDNCWYFYDNNKVVRRGDYQSTTMPLFVPLSEQPAISKNGGTANYYCEGYWMNYPANSGYTLRIYDTPDANNATGASREFLIPFSEDVKMPLKQEVEVNFSGESWFIIYRNDGKYLEGEHTFKQTDHGDKKITSNADASKAKKMRLISDGSGIYTFTLTFRGDGGENYDYYLNVDFPATIGDYRIVYSDNATWSNGAHSAGWYHPSDIIGKNTSETEAKEDTVSFFISHGSSPSMKFQRISAISESAGSYGKITWEDVPSGSITIPTSIEAPGVYNFIVTQPAGGASISLVKAEPYTGNYYIRTDCAGETKWNNFRSPDHLITYSEYSITHGGYSHYYAHWVQNDDKKNIQFCIANDYSSAISDTLVRENNSDPGWENINNYIDEKGNILRNANVRFMWNQSTNKVSRAYVDGAQGPGSNNFLYMLSEDGKIRKTDESALDDHKVFFSDNENWIYEANIQAQPEAAIKLLSNWGESNKITQYFKGSSSSTETLIDGSGEKWYNIRLLYDFKTNRLVAAMVPTGNIANPTPIHADVMFIREHQGDIDQLTFTGDGSITEIETAYAVMRFNKWTLNNKEKTGSHTPLASPASIYERSLYYVSFPFRVKLSEVFGFGTYGQHWIIQRYRGDLRAQQGYWAESAGFWEFIWNRNGEVYLEPNQGYILTLETELLGENSDVWGPNSRSSQIELFFPSTGNLGSITNTSITQTLPAHTCTINRHETEGLPETSNPRTSYNRTIFDSHWNIMSVPTYINVNNPNFANTVWIGDEKGNVGPKFLYTWNPDDNTLTATSGEGFMYHAMHAYTVQYYGNVTWTTSVTPSAAPQRNTEYRGEYEFCLEVQQDEQMIDRTFVRLSDDEKVTAGFEFGEDMTKQFNSRKANIFTIAGNTSLGGNSLPLSTTQTTVVPVGVSVKNAGDYTFAIPEGTEGIGVTLVDNETGIRTPLGALDYTVTLQPGDITDRFVLEISPIAQTPTGIEEPTSNSSLKGRAQKVMIDGILYIVKDGKIFDARGARVQ